MELLREEGFIREKSHQTWLKAGDCNTRYFYACLRSKEHQISHLFLKDGDGNELKGMKAMADAAASYYE